MTKWNFHIDKITFRANRALGFVKRNLRVKSRTLKERAYLSLVRPQIEYCSSIWDPRKGIESNGNYKIEMVQRRAVRWTLSNYDPKASVTDMLTNLGWRSLQQKRVDSRLSLLYKIAHNLTPSCHKDQLPPPPQGEDHATCTNSPYYLYHVVPFLIVCHSFHEQYRSGTIYFIMYLVNVTLSISFAIVFRHFNIFL